jgi:NAD(P)-dependent dehydrogenase (short-subunit alcohol dehydrogenase family)
MTTDTSSAQAADAAVKEARPINKPKEQRPPQSQDRQPGLTEPMSPRPFDRMEDYKPAGRFDTKSVVITGGDSGIGRAAAVGFAKEGANVAILYLDEHEDAKETQMLIEAEGREAILIAGDIGEEGFCASAVEGVLAAFGSIDVLVNNAAEQHLAEELKDITEEQLVRTFRTNIFSFFFMTKACLPHMVRGASIVNTASITAYKGNPELIDYSSTKGAIVAFTRSLSQNLAQKGIRVNAVAPGPVWTPLIPASFPPEKVAKFGHDTPLGRAGHPDEIAPAIIFLASNDASYITGQVIHINGGTIVNS